MDMKNTEIYGGSVIAIMAGARLMNGEFDALWLAFGIFGLLAVIHGIQTAGEGGPGMTTGKVSWPNGRGSKK